MAFEMSFDSSGQSFEIEDSADLDMSGGFASVLGMGSTNSASKKNKVEDDPWAMQLDIPTKKGKKGKNKNNDEDEPPAWMRSSNDNRSKKKTKESALSRADKYLKKSKKDKKQKIKTPARAEPETLSDMDFSSSSDEEDRNRKKKKEKKSMRVNMPSTSSGLSPTSDNGNSPNGDGGSRGMGMRRSSAQTNLGSGVGSSTLKRYQEEYDERNASPLTMGKDVKDRVSSGRSEVVRSASDLSGVIASSSSSSTSLNAAFGNVMSFADRFGNQSPPAVKKTPPKKSITKTTSPVQTRTEAFGNVMSFDQLMGGGNEVEDEIDEEVIVEVEEDSPIKSSGGRSEALGNIRGIEDLLGGGSSSDSTTNSSSTKNNTSSNNHNNHKKNNSIKNDKRNNKNYNNNKKSNKNTRSDNNAKGRPPLHAKPDVLEEAFTEMVEEEDLANSRSSSHGGKTPKAPNVRHPSSRLSNISTDNSSINNITRQDSVDSYMNDDFEDDDEDYSVDFDDQSHNRVSPRAAKMQQQHHHHKQQKQYRKRGKSRTTGTQANGTKDVGCQAMLVPLPPLGYDPMLYFGSPGMMMGGGMGSMGMMGSSGMMGGMGMMAPPSMMRMPPPRSFYGSGYYQRVPSAWEKNNAGSPGSSSTPSNETAANKTNDTTTEAPKFDGGDIFTQQMEASKLAFQKQLETIREHIHKTHARVAATAQAAGYQNYTTLASTQEYIARMRKPQPISFSEAMQTVGTKYAKEL
jgi:hypothetical protein